MVDLNKNVIVWPQAAGIGDLFKVLAEGLIKFKLESFEVLIGREAPSLKIHNPVYKQYYKDICKSFTLCKKLTIKEFNSNTELDAYISRTFSKEYNIYYANDYGWATSIKNINQIRELFPLYFKPQVDSITKNIFKSDKINICFHMKSLRNINEINYNVSEHMSSRCANKEKWVDFIEYVALSDKKINLVGIGVKEKDSPDHILKEELSKLIDLPNVNLPFLEETSIIRDCYFIKNCDLFIGCDSGPSAIAWLFSKPTIIYNLVTARQFKKDSEFEMLDTQIKKYGNQSLEEMIKIYDDYMASTYKLSLIKNTKERHKLYSSKLRKEIIKAVSTLNNIDKLIGWKSFDEAYYRLGLMYLNENFIEKDKKSLMYSNDFIDLHDVYQFYGIARLFKDKNQYDDAINYFKKVLMWAEGEGNNALLAASNFHLGEMSFKSRNYDKTIEYMSKCLNIIMQHKKAKEYLIKALNRLNKYKIAIWGASKVFSKVKLSLKNSKSIICVIDNNSNLWGKEKYKKMISSPSELVKKKPDIILICSKYSKDIKNQIVSMKLKAKTKIIGL